MIKYSYGYIYNTRLVELRMKSLALDPRLFTKKGVGATLGLTIIAIIAANGPAVGTAYLARLVPGVTIPDLTPNYQSGKLLGFFQDMGIQGREAYLTINNLDFLLIASYSLFALVALGVMLRYILRNQALASRLAWLGLVPGVCDLIESSCFRVIVTSPYNEHTTAASIAAVATKAKFLTISLMLLALIGLTIITLLTWYRRRAGSRRKARV